MSEIEDHIADVKAIAAGRTNYEGRPLPRDEALVAEIERLNVELQTVHKALEGVRPEIERLRADSVDAMLHDLELIARNNGNPDQIAALRAIELISACRDIWKSLNQQTGDSK